MIPTEYTSVFVAWSIAPHANAPEDNRVHWYARNPVSLTDSDHAISLASNSDPLFDAPSRDKKIITGTVIFPEYKKGCLKINVFPEYNLNKFRIIASVIIDRPGPFVISIPAHYKQVFIYWYNDLDGSGPPMKKEDRGFWLSTQPLILNDSITTCPIVSQKSIPYIPPELR